VLDGSSTDLLVAGFGAILVLNSGSSTAILVSGRAPH
jgi:hypothetical protein